jgi:glucose/arabinose dehydrogenase
VFARMIPVIMMMAIMASSSSCRSSRDTAPAQPTASLNLIASGFVQPVHITHAGDGSARMFVTEQCGRILIVKNGIVQPTPFLDIQTRVLCGGEQGLLSVAFPPGYAAKGHFYVYYTDLNGNIVISRYRLSIEPDAADPASEEILLTIPHPTFTNHNGGQLAFGPDGYLYGGTGDGGGGGDPNGNAQNPASLLGKIIRIDVESGAVPYAVPSGNPFVGNSTYRGEIWAYGLRNPWRFSFDRLTGDLFIADVGQGNYEEVDVQLSSSIGGENYGWNIMEGAHCYPGGTCNQTGLTLPVHEYDHSQGCSITGGFVLRGPTAASLAGRYIYGDLCSGNIWALRQSQGVWENILLADTTYTISTFGEDEAGNVYVADYSAGAVYQVVGN